MSTRLSESAVGKTVESANGEVIGTVAAVEGDTAVVEPNPGVMDSIRAALGWERAHEDTVMIHEDAIETVGDDVIRLESDPEAPDTQAGTDEPAHSPEADEPVLETEGGAADSDGLERDSAADRDRVRDEGIAEVERAGPAGEADRTEPTEQTAEPNGADGPVRADGTHPAADTTEDEAGTHADESGVDADPLRTDERASLEASSAADEAVDTDSRDGLEETAVIDETASTDAPDAAGATDTAGPTAVEGTDRTDESVDDADLEDSSRSDETPATPTADDSTAETPDQGAQGVSDEEVSAVDMADVRGVTDGEPSTENEPDDEAASDDERSDSEPNLSGAVTGGVDSGSLEDVSDGLDEADERSPTADTDLAAELDTGVDIESVSDASGAETDTDEPEAGADTSDVADRLDRGPDLESVVDSDDADERERGTDSSGTAEMDLAAKLATGPDLESVADAGRDPSVGIEPDAIEGEPTDPERGVDAVDRRIVTDETGGIDRRPAETAGERDRTALESIEPGSEAAAAEAMSTDDDRNRASGPLSAAVAVQRAALKPGRNALERGLEFQREIARRTLSGQVALQRQQLSLLETAASTPIEVAAAMATVGKRAVGGRLERVVGLDATDRERLADAGITSLEDLARADSETVAEAAGVTETRAERWIEQADA
ncbi:helix-hairpin-helix domain-containing protein [Natrinema versiforme]|uniref:ATPase AAA n=1 Tax=Natrinema versiforme JCM 10478 TaxID=1227496 RepID=L9XPQ1_9EURY|nr:helix-hairpin-helix domain-containing protein [Natrinema versiforme]ELY63799.1 ATPase AAA [Natrinema versiforme JCM 10478]